MAAFVQDADNFSYASFFYEEMTYGQNHPRTHKLKDGYPIERFSINPPSEYVCVVCYCVVRNPMECFKCGVLICEKCVENYKDARRQQFRAHVELRSDFACPNCREQAEPRIPSKVLLNIIQEMEVSCKHKVAGCDVRRQLRDIKAHEKNCHFKVIRCAYCGYEDSKDRFVIVTEEPHRKYSCSEACKETLKFQRLLLENRKEEALRMYFSLLTSQTEPQA